MSVTFEKTEHLAVLFYFAEGKPLDPTNETDHYNFGKYVAKMHGEMNNFTSMHKRYEWSFEKSIEESTTKFKECLSLEYQANIYY